MREAETDEALKTNREAVAFTTPMPFSADGDAVRHDALADDLRVLRDAGAGNTGPAVKDGRELTGQHGGAVREPLVDLADRDRKRRAA